MEEFLTKPNPLSHRLNLPNRSRRVFCGLGEESSCFGGVLYPYVYRFYITREAGLKALVGELPATGLALHGQTSFRMFSRVRARKVGSTGEETTEVNTSV